MSRRSDRRAAGIAWLAAVVLAAGAASGTDSYVKPTGSDGAAGTSWATDLLTISYGTASQTPTDKPPFGQHAVET